VTIGRNLIQQAFPGQPQMQAAFESLVAGAEDATARLSTAIAAIGSLSGNAENIVAELAKKQPLNSILTEIGALSTDPGVPEQVQPGSWQIRPIDAADTRSLLSRAEADTRYLGGAHSAASAAKLATARSISMSGDVTWTVSFDGSANVTAAGSLAAVNTSPGTFGSASQSLTATVDAKGRITALSAQAIAAAWALVTGKPTTLGGYGITDAVSASQLDTDPALTANSDTRIASQKAVKSYVSAAVTGALKFQGSTDASTNPNYPVASKGDMYVVTVAGKIGGASGTAVDAGDVYFAAADNAGGTQAAVGASWRVLEHNLVGALLSANNLSDLTDAPTARTNLGLSNPSNYPTLNQSTTGSAAKWTTARNVDGQPLDGSADITVIAPGTHAATSKATPVDADELPLVDSAASNVLKKLTWANLKATLKAYFDTLYVAIGGAYTAFAPTVAATSGTFTTASGALRYKQIGKFVHVEVIVAITTNGTAAGLISVSLPFVHIASGIQAVGSGREGTIGYTAIAHIGSGGSTLFIEKYDNTYIGGDGRTISVSIVYEAA
jgi:hypothetical protein